MSSNTFICAYCNQRLDYTLCTTDHILPKWLIKQAHESYNVKGNTIVACYSCNRKKDSRIWLPTVAHCYDEFRYFTWQEIRDYAGFVIEVIPHIIRYSASLISVPYEPNWLSDYKEVLLLWNKGWYEDNLKRKDRAFCEDGIPV